MGKLNEQDTIALITTVAVCFGAIIFARSVGTEIGAFFWGCVGLFIAGLTFGLSDSNPRRHALRVLLPALVISFGLHVQMRNRSTYAAAMPEDYERRTAPYIFLVPGLMLVGILLGSLKKRPGKNDSGSKNT